MAEGLAVVKVGGSLFDLLDLGPRLRAWLAALDSRPVLLVPGGGPAANVIRDLDRRHGLGEEAAHWLALQALSLTARFLQALLPGSGVVAVPYKPEAPARDTAEPSLALRAGTAILDPYPFLRADEGRPGCLPHSWDVTSDAVAARAAVVAGARRLVLLKSVTIPMAMTWEEASRHGFVDGMLAQILKQVPTLQASAVNFRAWQPGRGPSPAAPAGGPGPR